jgi:hypothetical protein
MSQDGDAEAPSAAGEEAAGGCEFVSAEDSQRGGSDGADDRPQPDAPGPIDSIAKRARTAPRPHRYRTKYFRAPPQADYICRARSATSESFERSQTPSAMCDPGEMYYRERATYEEQRKRQFDHDCIRRYHARCGRSPYRYEMVRHLEAVQRAFHQECVASEHHAMQERNLAMLRYRAAVRDSWGHDAKLVKSDQLHRVHRCLRILAV